MMRILSLAPKLPSSVRSARSKRSLQALHIGLTCLLMAALFTALEPRAYAYIDPGSGLLACQSISAMFAGILFFLRHRLRGLFHRAPPAPKNSRPDAPASTLTRQA
jgi:hypothetical protein